MANDLDRLLSQYSQPVGSWPGEEGLDEEARANLAAMQAAAPPTSGWDRDTILPWAYEVKDGKRSPSGTFAMPQMAVDAWNAIKGLGSAPLAAPINLSETPEMIEKAGAVVGPMAGVGMARGALTPHGGSELGVFGGRLAKTADHAALAKAEEMAAAGLPREQIWGETGWFQGVDGKWRFEIDDFNAQLARRSADMTPGKSVPLHEAYKHPDLYGAYPDAANIRFAFTEGYSPSEAAFAKMPSKDGAPPQPVIAAGHDPKRPGASDLGAASTLPHELQHYIQELEGFPSGGSTDFGHSRVAVEAAAREAYEHGQAARNKPKTKQQIEDDELLRELGVKTPDMSRPWEELSPRERLEWNEAGRHRLYTRLAGEVEARAVQARQNLFPAERLARPPWLDYDIPEGQQIVRFGEKGPQMSADELPRYSSPDSPENAIMARKREAGYLPEPKAQRPFTDDYRGPVEGVDGSPLKTDIEGRPLVAPVVAGRRTAGGVDIPLTEKELAGVAEQLGSWGLVPRSELPRRAVGSFNPRDNAIKVANNLDPEQTAVALAHELGHAIDNSSRNRFPLDGSAVAARKVYHDLRTGDTRAQMPKQFHSPELDGYAKASVGDELRAELLRAYMMDPNYLKTTAPKAAAAIREAVNADPWLKKVIQFNVSGVPGLPLSEERSVDDILKPYSKD